MREWRQKVAKLLLIAFRDHPFRIRCGECDTIQPFQTLPPGHRVADYTIDGQTYDVAVLSMIDDSMIGVIQVHPCNDETLLGLHSQVSNGHPLHA